MRTLRRHLAPTLVLLLPLLACGYSKPSSKKVLQVLSQPGNGLTPKLVAVPRSLETHTDESMGGGPLDDRQLAKVDGALALLRVSGLVELADVYGPDGRGGYSHTITVKPAADAPPDLFTETDEPYNAPSYSSVRRTPGWTVIIARPKLVGVSRILDANNPEGERISPGYIQATVAFKWVPTAAGVVFDQNSTSFEDLPSELQRGAADTGYLDSGTTYYGTVWMTRGKQGDWRVTLFQCRRCS